MNILNPNSEVMRALEGIFYLIVLGLLWLLLSFTIIGIGPASVAFYYAIAKSVRKGRGTPFQEFFSALKLKQNWLTALIINVLLLLFGWVLYIYDWNYIIIWINTGTMPDMLQTVLAIVKTFFLLGIACFVYPIISRFKVNVPKALMLSLFFCLRYFWITILAVALLLLALVVAIAYPALSWFVPGVFVWLLSYPLESILRKYVPDADNSNPDAWYLEK